GRPRPPARGTRAATLVVAIVVFLPQIASACPVCFGGAGSVSKGMDSAIWFLLGTVAFVQIGFVALFFSFWRRGRALRRRREQFHLIEGGAR
ncbi:MAG TPA: hypothetical protein VIO12_04110, partial [Thermoanaerobaculia bacterium]